MRSEWQDRVNYINQYYIQVSCEAAYVRERSGVGSTSTDTIQDCCLFSTYSSLTFQDADIILSPDRNQ